MPLCKTVKEDLKALRACGVNPTDEEIVLLNDLARKVELKNQNFDLATLPRVAFIGQNIVFHEPTIGSLEWWQLYGSEASDSDLDLIMVYFFMLAHATSIDVLFNLKTSKQILDAVKEWLKTVDATEQELWAGLMWVKYGDTPEGEFAAETLNKEDEEEEVNEEDREKSYLYSILLDAAALTGINPNDLKTQTVSNLDKMIIWAKRRAGYDVKPSIAKDYIAYKQMLKKIEERRDDPE